MTEETIDICICTYRRDSLVEALVSISSQVLPSSIGVRVIVADNDISPDRCDDITNLGRTLKLNLIYIHAPFKNISIARNACLYAATSEWLAFMDDDEIASPDWIDQLVAKRGDVEIVFGVSQARYPHETSDSWIARGDFHSNKLQGNDQVWNGYTSNVLLNRTWLLRKNLIFSNDLGQTGGEDTLLFYNCFLKGARFAYAPKAVVFEDVLEERNSLGWLLRRRYRSGQIHFMILRLEGKNRIGSLIFALAKSIFSFASMIPSIVDPVSRGKALLRGAMHIGVAAAAVGVAPYLEYGVARVGRKA